jgi:hypothetical protein
MMAINSPVRVVAMARRSVVDSTVARQYSRIRKRAGLMSLDPFHDGRYPSILDSIVYRMFMSAKVY